MLAEKCAYCGRGPNGGSGLGSLMTFEYKGVSRKFCDASICFDGWLEKERGYGIMLMTPQVYMHNPLTYRWKELSEKMNRERLGL